MTNEIKKVSNEQLFIIISFLLSLILSFMFGYLTFRFLQEEGCKSPIEIVRQAGN